MMCGVMTFVKCHCFTIRRQTSAVYKNQASVI